MTVIRLIARPMLASMFFVGGAGALKNAAASCAEGVEQVTDQVAPLAERVAPALPVPDRPGDAGPDQRRRPDRCRGSRWRPAALPRLSAAVLAASLVPTTFAGHPFWEEQDPAPKAAQRMHFFKNVSMLGGLLIAGGRHRGQAGRRLAGPPGREGRAPRGQARWPRRPAAEARIAKAHLS